MTGDGLLGHPRRAPYHRVIATCAVRRIPYTWVRQTQPGGTILATVGSCSYGTGLARVTVDDDGAAKELIPSVDDGGQRTTYLFDPGRESFAELSEDSGGGWTVRQGGPAALWDDVEQTLTAWQEADRPDIDEVQLRITARSHTYWIGDTPGLRWEHHVLRPG